MDESRPFHAIVWPGGGRPQERVDLSARSHEDAVALLRQTYGAECEFDLTDVRAATKLR